jgi:mercuric reductase
VRTFDLAIVGSGAAGFAAAIAARRRDARVVMIEAGTVGGTCVNTGCVPSKALLAAAQARQLSLVDRFPGVSVAPSTVDLPGLVDGTDALVTAMRSNKYVELASKYAWEILAGAARFRRDGMGPVLRVELPGGGFTAVRARHYLVATGATPWAPPIDGLAEVGYLTSATAMGLHTLPTSMIVIGGNAVGLEQAQLWRRLGVEVTVVEAMDRLTPGEEPEASAAIEAVFADEGIGVVTGGSVTRVRRDRGRVTVSVRDREGHDVQLRTERLLVATGRRPSATGLDLDEVGVEVGPAGQIMVDEHLRTTNPRIWAAGDVTGVPQFVYVAARHGEIASDNALTGADRTVDYTHLPRVTFTSPAIAAVGLTERQAVAAGYHCDCRVLSLEHLPRAVVNRDIRGMVKLVADSGSGRLLGIHAVADGAGELAAAAVYVLAAGMTVTQLAELWSPYLTAVEALKLAAQTFTRDVAQLSCCAA